MTIENIILNKINQQGYINIDDYVKEISRNNYNSYYKNVKTIGEDFITSPEISQLFGEIIAIWILQEWFKLKSPKINLLELGPGNGTLINDILNSTKHIKNFHSSLKVYLYDINPHLIKKQKSKLKNYDVEISWINHTNINNDNKTIIIANEFFDCLLYKQYIHLNNIWKEQVIKIDNNKNYCYSAIPINKDLNTKLKNKYCNAKENAILEISEETSSFIKQLLRPNIYKCLFIDYGYYINPLYRTNEQYKSTLQGIYKNQYNSIFNNIGDTDLTFHVDFFAIEEAARKNNFSYEFFCSQKDFLLKYGIRERLAILIGKNPELKSILCNQYSLVSNMGNSIGLLAIISSKEFLY